MSRELQSKHPVSNEPAGFRQAWFPNLVDHFNPRDNSTYQQRYWYNKEHFDKRSGPVFLYICGEYTCSVPETRMFASELAAAHKALFVVLEHRYYGASKPFEDWSLENLRLLTVDNALADIAFFID